jgi:hypothetical protein
VFVNEIPAHAVSCTVNSTGSGQTLSAPTDGNRCTFEFSTSNVVDLSGSVEITVTLANGSGSNDYTIGLAATIIDPNGPNNNIALTGIDGFDNLGYNNAATAALTGWALGGSRCGNSGSYQLDRFGSLTECFSGPRDPGPVFALLNDDPGNFTANDQGVLFCGSPGADSEHVLRLFLKPQHVRRYHRWDRGMRLYRFGPTKRA